MLIGTKKSSISSKNLGENLLVNPGLLNSAAGWAFQTSAGNPTITANGPSGSNAVSFLGTGSPLVGYPNVYQYISVVPGGVYGGSCWGSISSITLGNCQLFVSSDPLATNYTGLLFTNGYNRNFTLWTCPANISKVAIALQCNDCTINSGQYVYLSQPFFARFG
jgi:hypothetical protein